MAARDRRRVRVQSSEWSGLCLCSGAWHRAWSNLREINRADPMSAKGNENDGRIAGPHALLPEGAVVDEYALMGDPHEPALRMKARSDHPVGKCEQDQTCAEISDLRRREMPENQRGTSRQGGGHKMDRVQPGSAKDQTPRCFWHRNGGHEPHGHACPFGLIARETT